jgi:hypothetical protein
MKKWILILFLLPTPALSAEICVEFEAGPALDRLTTLCNMMKVNYPAWTNEDCARYFIVVGGRALYEKALIDEANAAKKASVKTGLGEYDTDLPSVVVPGMGIGIP